MEHMSSITEDVLEKFVISLRGDINERQIRRVTVARHNERSDGGRPPNDHGRLHLQTPTTPRQHAAFWQRLQPGKQHEARWYMALCLDLEGRGW
jgi:hypothetical protein